MCKSSFDFNLKQKLAQTQLNIENWNIEQIRTDWKIMTTGEPKPIQTKFFFIVLEQRPYQIFMG